MFCGAWQYPLSQCTFPLAAARTDFPVLLPVYLFVHRVGELFQRGRVKLPGMTADHKIFIFAGLLAFAPATLSAAPQLPDLGSNVFVFDPSMSSAAIQRQIDEVYAIQQHSEFGSARYALLFLPGSYSVDIPIGFYTQILGLGAT